ncbi:amino acid aminotransferase [Roseovarius pelagicus]|uniref:Aspartate/tyrosine/aromatic aminotransferase n=1 Tax=Roseovarius pelagicus TaxID=2980108 RepID=A0ABY6DFE1_9RHOB|nr:amino acid aminotransferase [Roseovarius pelagicus]UXX84869.1 aspartate/tyrosine/aromatic aminotransferase [Roseovarius pelagicus]
MLNALNEQSPDKILMLMQAFKEDPRPVKIDLGVGVYKNANGQTPIMRAVKKAEQQWWEEETSKSYVNLAGDPEFSDMMIGLILGSSVARNSVAAIATPGGTGALRQAFELIQMASPEAKVFVSDPTWPNHLSILRHLGIETVSYRYFDSATGAVNFDGMMQDLAKVSKGDVVLLHGCCHNPTGANLNLTEWQTVVDLLNEIGAVPMIDIAYQGFGDGLEADAKGTRLVATSCPETLIAASCSKNFGIYRERTGILMAVSQDSSLRNLAQSNMTHLNRQNYSFPPDHGARLVTHVLRDDDLRADWQAELDDIRNGMLTLRQQLADELQRLSGSNRFGFIAQHRGMFSRLGLSSAQVEQIRADHAIYMVGDSRINIAGLNDESVPLLADAMIKVGA